MVNLDSLDLLREKRRSVHEKARQEQQYQKELLIWLTNQRLELLGSCHGSMMITFRRMIKRGELAVYQDFKQKPEIVPLLEIGPHGRRRGDYLTSIK